MLGQVIGASLRSHGLLAWSGPTNRLAPALGIPLALGSTATALRHPDVAEGLAAEGAYMELSPNGRQVLVAQERIRRPGELVRAQGLLNRGG